MADSIPGSRGVGGSRSRGRGEISDHSHYRGRAPTVVQPWPFGRRGVCPGHLSVPWLNVQSSLFKGEQYAEFQHDAFLG